MSELTKFLESHKTTNSRQANFMNMKGGNILIHECEFDEFFKLYSKYYKTDKPALAERRREKFTLVIDLDFKDKTKADDEQEYKYEQVEVINHINEFLRDGLHEDTKYIANEDNILYSTNENCDNFHIMYPGELINEDICKQLYPELIKDLNNAFPEPTKPWCEVVDEKVFCFQQLRMLGSVKSHTEDRIYYPCTIDFEEGDITIRKKLTPEILKKYSMFLNSEGDIVTCAKKQENKEKQKKDNNNNDEAMTDVDLEKIINGLKDERANDYSSWTVGCWSIFNYCHEKKINASPYIHMFSKKCISKYDDHKVDDFINKLQYKENGSNIGTLMHWLKKDNVPVFREITKSDINTLIYHASNGTDYDIAKVIYERYKDEFVFSNNKWYYYDGNKWVYDGDEGELILKNKISTVIVKLFSTQAVYYNNKATQTTDEPEQQKYLDLYKKLNARMFELKKDARKKAYINQCKELFNDSKFHEKLDTNPGLLGFDNGVYDLDLMVFRESLPSDNISMTCGYDYDHDVDVKYVDEVMKFVREIMPNEENVNYILTILAYALHGIKDKEFFNIWTGSGGNGKSLLNDLISHAFGDYYHAPSALIYTTTKNDSSKANPEIYALKGKRIIISEEPCAGTPIKSSIIKELTGNNKLSARNNYDTKFIEFKPQFLPIICCNIIPLVDSYDGGFMRRVDIEQFMYKFVHEPILSNEKLIDTTLKRKFSENIEYSKAFMNILIKKYNEYRQNGSVIMKPKEVTETTNKYLEECNVVKYFLNNHVIITDDQNDCISASELHTLFKDNTDHSKKNDTKWFKSQMSQNGFNAVKKTTRGRYCNSMVYFGMKLQTNNDSDDDDSAYGFIDQDDDALDKKN